MSPAEREAIAAYLDPIIRGAPCDPILRQIPRHLIGDIWPVIDALMVKLVQRSAGAWTIAGILERLERGEWQLWVVWDGRIMAVLATELYAEMSGRRCARIVFTTGHDARKWSHLIADIETWALAQGCCKLEMIARKGWAKATALASYRMTHVLLERTLEDRPHAQ